MVWSVDALEILERRICKDGKVLPGGVLNVDSFLNHQMDPALFMEMAKEFYRLYRNDSVNKIITIETSGIGIACITGLVFGCPVLFARKHRASNMSGEYFTKEVKSFTHGDVSTIYLSKKYLTPEDRVLIVDDFLANGAALDALISLVEQAGATVVGAGIAIEKNFQPGGEMIRARGCRVESLARIKSMGEDGSLEFCR
jgi:xanthine phosphoribosyltransferase